MGVPIPFAFARGGAVHRGTPLPPALPPARYLWGRRSSPCVSSFVLKSEELSYRAVETRTGVYKPARPETLLAERLRGWPVVVGLIKDLHRLRFCVPLWSGLGLD